MKKRIRYAGIGSRETPASMEPVIRECAERLEKLGAMLRSGGAKGADLFFQNSVKPENTEIFVVDERRRFPGAIFYSELDVEACDRAMMMAKKYHPAWNALSHFVKLLMARNSMQIFGKDMRKEDVVDFVVCWTVGGELKGGTSQALRIAIDHGIPIFNLGSATGLAEFNIHMRKLEQQ